METEAERKKRIAAENKRDNAAMKKAGDPFSNTTMAERIKKQLALAEIMRKRKEKELLR